MYPWPLRPCIIIHTSMQELYISDPAKSLSISWEFRRLGGGYPCVWSASQAWQTFLIHPRDMRKVWQPIHGHCYFSSQPTHPWGWLGGFANPAKSWLASRVVCGLDGGHSGVWSASQACETFTMYPQNMWKIWKPIHGHWNLTLQPTPPWGWLSSFADPAIPGPTSREVYGIDGGHHCVWIVSQACQRYHMYTQGMWKVCQPIHGHWYLIPQPIPLWGWPGDFADDPVRPGTTSRVECDLDWGWRVYLWVYCIPCLWDISHAHTS